ncbi:DSS1/SEM1 family protein [Akanthomyces lecanii RCEF 1005]|uniref:26S proteasome complex subunit SEM1 n=1 Tax=Akanthomyces lecanii RCEF 1005 TaxID=1081108 RepID=A0A168DUY5_CORDF|nr:DSS1/SEM1 family protein [Akanthomyces lecanii RCEF 1005]
MAADKIDDKTTTTAAAGDQQQQPPKETKATALGEDDEFEDFPVDDWPEDQTEAAQGSGQTKHLWEESWDDDDTTDDFSTQLKEELKKVESSKRR